MKKGLLIAFLFAFAIKTQAQENMVTISGGYSFANIEDTDTKGTGWRINGLYEFNPRSGMLAHGISLGYVSLQAAEGTGSLEVENKVGSIPIYYAPKLSFGKEKIKVFVKGALGMQYATLKREGYVETTAKDLGFYGGGGAGLMLFLKENIFINAEYEIVWVSNSSFKDGWLNTAGGGIGMKF